MINFLITSKPNNYIILRVRSVFTYLKVSVSGWVKAAPPLPDAVPDGRQPQIIFVVLCISINSLYSSSHEFSPIYYLQYGVCRNL